MTADPPATQTAACRISAPARAGALGVTLAMLTFLPACMPWGNKNVSTDDLTRRAVESTVEGEPRAISYLVSGDADAQRVIYVHGTPGDAGAYAEYIRDPVFGAESVAIDRPGFGASGKGVVRSFHEQAAAIEPLLVERSGRWPILVGHSLGGPIIARVAGEHPDKVHALVIVAGSLDPELEEWKWYNRAAVAIGFALPRSLRNSNNELRTAKRETAELAPLLSNITCPVVIVHGDKDSLVPVENVDYMRERLTNAERVEVIIIEGEDHFTIWTQEDLIRTQIAKLLGE